MNKYLEVLFCFFKLGLISFGGPAAHIGYFQHKFVGELKWLDQQEFSQLLSLSQFLPGPGSSQIGFAIGYKQAGYLGAVLAFVGFTLPSFILMFALAVLTEINHDAVLFSAIINGLKLLAVVVVADAVVTMFNAFCKNNLTRFIALLSTLLLLLVPSLMSQMVVLVIGAAIALVMRPNAAEASDAVVETTPVNRVKPIPLFIFFLLFLGLPLFANANSWLDLFANFYHSGSLVFGGGHVVLPLLQESLQGDISTDRFITGYALAQAVPGPMFTLATFLGADLSATQPLMGALVATLAIFLPGFLLILALQQTWQSLAKKPVVASMVIGINASVVGLLMSAFYRPVFESSVHNVVDLVIVVIGFYLLKYKKIAIGKLVFGFACCGYLLSFI